jgi:phage terminase large subunit-like protein
VRGRVEPRIWTPAQRDLSDPDASWGWDFIDFCEEIGYPLDEWQRWLAVHLGELLPDGSPRFRMAIVLVARQNGKSLFACLLVLYWMFIEKVPLVYGTHKDRSEAKKAWAEAIELAESIDLLAEELPEVHIVKQISEEDFFNSHGSHYQFGAPNRRAARGKTVYRALIDELREQRNRDCWNALVPATNAVGNPLILCISNEGGMDSVVLHEEHDSALADIETGRLGTTFLASWSCPPGSDPEDLEALAYANPSLNRIRPNGTGLRAEALLGQALTAKRAGGTALADFKVEMMCMRVDLLDPAIDPDAWKNAGTDDPIDLAQHRRQVALAFDVSLDGTHCTLMAAAVVDGLVHVEVVKKWHGHGCTKALRAEMPALVAKIKPRVVVWLPSGPAAAVAAALAEKRGVWPPRRVEVVEARSDVAAICMGLAELVAAGELRHPRDPMLDEHVARTQRLAQGTQGQWVYARRDSGPIDGTYALAAAVDAARTLPAPPPPLTVA